MNPAFWRRWHRWIAFPAALFLLFAAVTGVITAMTEFVGEAEALREATRDMVSPIRTDSAADAWQLPLAQALARAATESPGAPIDKIQSSSRDPSPPSTSSSANRAAAKIDVWVFDANTGALLRTDTYADKPLIHRIHSGEAFGDGGLVFAMMWGTTLAFLTVSGFVIYLTMRRRNPTGLQRVFW